MTDRRNVVLVTIDCLRADHCSFMGYERETTPTLDAMASDGIVFENAIAPGPSTSESMPAIFSGSYPSARPGDGDVIDERISRIRPHMQSRRTLAEAFSEAGYATAGFSPNPFTTRYFGFQAGFDRYEDFLDGSHGRLYEHLIEGRLSNSELFMPLRVLFNWLQKEEVFKTWEQYYDDLLEWTAGTSRPYFLWVHLMDVHHPYLASREDRSSPLWKNMYANWRLRAQDYEPPFAEWVDSELVTAYDDSIAYADRFLAELTDDLAGDDPVVVVSSDHGESFGEHDAYEHHGGAFGQHGEQEYHSYLYEENIHVPLVVGNVDRDETVSDPFSLRRLSDLFGLERNGPLIQTDVTDDFVRARTIEGSGMAVRGEHWKYIDDGDRERVFDLREGETEPVEDDQLRAALGELAAISQRGTAERERLVSRAKTVADASDV